MVITTNSLLVDKLLKRKHFEKRAQKQFERSRSKCDFEFDALTENVLMLVRRESYVLHYKHIL